MSKVALNVLMERVIADAAKKINGIEAAKQQRRDFYFDANAMTIDVDDLIFQTRSQLEKYYKVTIKDPKARTALQKIVEKQYKALVESIKKKALPLVRVKGEIILPDNTSKLFYEHEGDSITVYAFPTMRTKVNKKTGQMESKTSDNYDRLYTAIFKSTATAISPMKQIQIELEKEKGFIETYLNNKKGMLDKTGGSLSLFDIGHAPASNIEMFVSKRIQGAVTEASEQTGQSIEKIRAGLKEVLTNLPMSIEEETGESILLDIESKFTSNSKVFIIGTKPESSLVNRGKNENQYLGNLNNAIFKYIREQDADYWVEHEGSDSKIKATAKEIMQTAASAGFIVADKELLRPIDKKPNKVKTTIKTPRKVYKVKKQKLGVNIPGTAPERSGLATTSYLSLIVLLNEKLPPQVRSNMGTPRLNNRTGNFSESARVTDIIETPQGFPSIGYTYQRSPYDVFDRTKGKAPWNTPERDPSQLVAMSVRQLATQLGMRRFFTRRSS